MSWMPLSVGERLHEGVLKRRQRYKVSRDIRIAKAPELKIGERVKLSSLGIERSTGLKPPHCGQIVGRSPPHGYRVLFDGRKSPLSLHGGYLEKTDLTSPEEESVLPVDPAGLRG